MYRKLFLVVISFSLLFSSFLFAQDVNIQGTYRLVTRVLPDGTRLKAPDIMGFATFTKTYRTFNMTWRNKNGKYLSHSYVSTYKLTGTEYTEKIIFSVMNNEPGVKEPTYVISGDSATAPVKVTGGKIEIKMPFDPVTIVFNGDRFVATSEGNFTDYWEKVD